MSADTAQSLLSPYADTILGRLDQALPALSEAEIARIERFGKRRLLTAGDSTPGMFVLLKGTLTRGELRPSQVVPIVCHYVRSGSVKRVGGAIGEGAAAVAPIHEYLSRAG